MRILITNDDSIHAPGLKSAEKIARTLSEDVWIVAPESDQSGIGHALSLSNPLRAREVDAKVFAVNGTPADCVIFAVRQLMERAPDVILSGVNCGQNIADDVHYSGTVAGAMEGALLGIPSFALSQAYAFDGKRTVKWETCERHGPGVIEKVLNAEIPARRVINVNCPNCAPDEVQGIAVTAQGTLNHGLYIEERLDGRRFPYHWITFDRAGVTADVGYELHALRTNRISVSALQPDLTDRETNMQLKVLFP